MTMGAEGEAAAAKRPTTCWDKFKSRLRGQLHRASFCATMLVSAVRGLLGLNAVIARVGLGRGSADSHRLRNRTHTSTTAGGARTARR